MLAHIVTDQSITVVFNGVPRVINDTHPNFNKVVEEIKANRWDDLEPLFDLEEAVRSFVSGHLVVHDGSVSYKGQALNNAAVDRLFALMNQGFNVEPLVAFLEKVCENPDPRAVQGLYEWLERGNLPITADGQIIGYKIVTNDYKDIYTRSFDNSVGKTVSIPRFACDSDPDQTCSRGLHFCSAEYLPNFGTGGDKVMLVSVNPKDVVAFPKDYNISKGRCCEYKVVAEVPRETAGSYFDNTPVFNIQDPDEFASCEDEEEDYIY